MNILFTILFFVSVALPSTAHASSVTEKRVVTGYSAADSCHYPKNGGCLTASGKLAKVGYAACPRSWKFGTKVEVAGKVYSCQDRLAQRYDDRIDLWFDNQRDAIVWGKRKLDVKVMSNDKRN